MAQENLLIENLFKPYISVIGKDFEKYRNHVYRVFLNCIQIDRLPENEDKYAIAAVFHDIGIWTHGTIDYLKPSMKEVNVYLSTTGPSGWKDEIECMIYWHHKLGKYRGNWLLTTSTFRKADWIDVSLGILHFGLNRKLIKGNRKTLPNEGFHVFLLKKILRNFFRHPLNPLPMFKR